MNLSKQTVDIIKNFSTINASIAVDVGNTLQTMSAMKNNGPMAGPMGHSPKMSPKVKK